MVKIIVKGGAVSIGSHTIIELLETTYYEVIFIDNSSNSLEKKYERIEEFTGKKVRIYTKQIGEQILQDYTNIHRELNVIALRYFNPVGAHPSGLNGEDPVNPPTSLVPVITQTAIGKRTEMYLHGTDYETRDGTCIRDYVHVMDITTAHFTALDYLFQTKTDTNFEIINLGSGDVVSVFEAIKAFELANKQKLNYKFGPKREGDFEAIYSDNAKAKQKLFWETKYSLSDMMESAWRWERNDKH